MQKKIPVITEKKETHSYLFRLYITGASPNSSRAITNIKLFFDKLLVKNYELEIIDVYQDPSLAKQENIIALPLLIKKHPLPERKLIGDMSDSTKLSLMLGIENNE
ncbi:MAG: circadian clock KaiB family protein [Chitinophagaceae bacterium]